MYYLLLAILLISLYLVAKPRERAEKNNRELKHDLKLLNEELDDITMRLYSAKSQQETKRLSERRKEIKLKIEKIHLQI